MPDVLGSYKFFLIVKNPAYIYKARISPEDRCREQEEDNVDMMARLLVSFKLYCQVTQSRVMFCC